LKGLVGLATGTPLTLAYFASRQLRGRIARRLREGNYDLIYVFSSSMAHYVDGEASHPVVMDFVDVDSDKWIQFADKTRPPLAWLYRTEGMRLRSYEAEVARSARLCVLATAAEEALLKSFAPWANTAVIPNGIDLDHFTPVASAVADPTLIFTGAMDYLPNIDAVHYFCSDIYPVVRREVPEVRFLIVGLNPPASVLRLGRLPGVVVTGTVPDVRPFYAQASVCVAPLRIARGVQTKILQGMAMGLPVITTSRGCQGIEARPGQDLLVEDDPIVFATRLVELLRNPTLRCGLGRRARAFVEAHHPWESSLARLEALLRSTAASQPGSMVSPA
ncbi:MAG: TIGR03087 family PEP-CTERM/XrtA system glycosyltransferase, partial [Candidatus Rokuibacteriota bacterium]